MTTIVTNATPVLGPVEVISGHLVSATTDPNIVVIRLVRDADQSEVHLPVCPPLAQRLSDALGQWAKSRSIPVDFRAELVRMLGVIATCRQGNQRGWMEYLVEEVNKSLALIGEKDRAHLHQDRIILRDSGD